ncbi:MAG: outer membrane protein assembly factor BamA [Candidatus Latescibacterota bacterium]
MSAIRRVAWFGAFVAVLWGTARGDTSLPEKPRIVSVHFEGNRVFEERRLYRLMTSRPSTWLRRSRYNPEALKEDLKNLELFYRQNGYLEARIAEHGVAVDSTRNEAKLSVQVFEGDLTRVEGVSVFGNRAFSNEELLGRIPIRAEDPFQRAKIEDAIQSLLALYADNGYLDAQSASDARVNTQTHRVLIDFTVREMAQYKIGQIRLAGLEKTRPHVVRRELSFRPDQTVDYSLLLKSQRRLYLTGLFQSVFLRPQPPSSGDATEKDILIELRELPSREFNVSLGYDSIERMRGKVEVSNRNLAGTARKLGLAARMSFIHRSLEASFTEPWTFGTPWRADVTLTSDAAETPGYRQRRLGGGVTFGRAFLRRSTVTFAHRQEKVSLRDIRVTPAPEKTEVHLRSMKLSFLYDARDDLFNSTDGSYLEWSNELVGSFLGGTEHFFRSVGRLKRFYPLNPSTILATALEAGWVDREDLPLNERFYAGGPTSLRGFEDQRAGPLDQNRIPMGGSFKVVWNVLEIRRSLYGMVGGVLFAEAGNVWSRSEDFSFRDLRPAVGLGLRVNTPIGLIRLDYGRNLDRRPGEPGSKLYFSMGQAF